MHGIFFFQKKKIIFLLKNLSIRLSFVFCFMCLLLLLKTAVGCRVCGCSWILGMLVAAGHWELLQTQTWVTSNKRLHPFKAVLLLFVVGWGIPKALLLSVFPAGRSCLAVQILQFQPWTSLGIWCSMHLWKHWGKKIPAAFFDSLMVLVINATYSWIASPHGEGFTLWGNSQSWDTPGCPICCWFLI